MFDKYLVRADSLENVTENGKVFFKVHRMMERVCYAVL